MFVEITMIRKFMAVFAILSVLVAIPSLVAHPLSEQRHSSSSEVQQIEAQAGASADPEAVIAWNAIAVRTILAPPTPQPPPSSFVYASFVQAAVYNAVVAIEGGYQLYKSRLESSPGASVDAAIAAAAHHVLVHYFSSQQGALDAE